MTGDIFVAIIYVLIVIFAGPAAYMAIKDQFRYSKKDYLIPAIVTGVFVGWWMYFGLAAPHPILLILLGYY